MNKSYLVLFLGFLLSGCASQYLKSSQRVNEEKKPYSKILVLGHFQNPIARGLLEKEVSQNLMENGINSTASKNSEIDFKLDSKLTDEARADIKRQLIQNGFDGVIVTNLIDVQEYREVVPGTFATAALPDHYMGFGTYIGYYPAVAWQPGQVNTGTQFVLESALYALDQEPGNALQWVGRFVVEDPEDIRKSAAQYARELCRALYESNIRKP